MLRKVLSINCYIEIISFHSILGQTLGLYILHKNGNELIIDCCDMISTTSIGGGRPILAEQRP